MTYTEVLEEVKNPIYKDSAKVIWDSTYDLFKDNFEIVDIYSISSSILESINKEILYNLDYSIFDLIRTSDAEIKHFLQVYINAITAANHNYNPLQFIQSNLDTICIGTKLKELICIFKGISLTIGKDRMYLINGAYDDGKLYFLMNYCIAKKNKITIKEIVNTKIKWRIKLDSKQWHEDDIVLEDMSFVWPSHNGYSRFIDNNGNWGFINVIENKRYYMPDYVHSMRDYLCGRAVYLDSRNKLYGYIDVKGNILIEPKFRTAMDFIHLYGRDIAAVEYSLHHQRELSTNPERMTLCGDAEYMGITIFKNLITIDLNGNFTPEIQAVYDEEKKKYFAKLAKEEETRKQEMQRRELMRIISTPDYDDEDQIMSAIGNGYGDIYGY